MWRGEQINPPSCLEIAVSGALPANVLAVGKTKKNGNTQKFVAEVIAFFF